MDDSSDLEFPLDLDEDGSDHNADIIDIDGVPSSEDDPESLDDLISGAGFWELREQSPRASHSEDESDVTIASSPSGFSSPQRADSSPSPRPNPPTREP